MNYPAVPVVRSWRKFFGVAIVLLAVYALNVIAGKTAVLLGYALPLKLNDVGEFLAVLVAMFCFVTGILLQEQKEDRS